jgi:hypothetical protein
VTSNPDFKDLLNLLNRCEARHLVVGGYAVMLCTEPRYTKGLDIWIDATPQNAARVCRAFAEFGAPLAGIGVEEFGKADLIYQLGVPPSRIDVLTSISGVNFEDAWPRRVESDLDDVRASFISIEHLIENKKSRRRLADLVDCEVLEKAKDLL